MKIPEKFMSRKFIEALVANTVGIVTLIWGVNAGEQMAVIAGAVITIASVLGYIKVEGDIDREAVK